VPLYLFAEKSDPLFGKVDVHEEVLR